MASTLWCPYRFIAIAYGNEAITNVTTSLRVFNRSPAFLS